MNDERVFNHLRRADYLLVFLPMILAAVLFILVPIILIMLEKANGNSGGIGGFDYSGLVIFAGIFFWLIFCGAYFFLAIVLSILTRRNATFRFLIVAVAVLAGIGFYVLFFK